MESPGKTDVLHQLGDELRIQAWLAGAEFRNPSLKHETTRQELDALARLRDELRVQLHLGKLEARREFERLEERWGVLKRLAVREIEEAEESVHDVLREIRDGYVRLRD